MADKKLKKERKMFRYTDRVIKRVKAYGYGENDKYRSKPDSVCYWTKEGGNFVSYDKSKLQMIATKLRWFFNITVRNYLEAVY